MFLTFAVIKHLKPKTDLSHQNLHQKMAKEEVEAFKSMGN